MRGVYLALGLLLVIPSARAQAGPLRSATLEHTFRVGALAADVISVQVAAINPSGLLHGGEFSLDAGSAFAGTSTVPAPRPRTWYNPVTRATIAFGRNGRLGGTLGAASVTPASGISGYERLRAKIGKSPAFTLLHLPQSVGAGANVRVPPSTITSTTLVASQFGDVWHLGAVTQTGLTSAGRAIPDARAAGSVSVTPSGNTRVALVSLSRIRVRGLVTFTSTTLARLTLVYAPEPAAGWLLTGAAVGLAGIGATGRRGMRARC
jgi:hypothetical protein